jgi:hypothetical protein
MRMSRRLPALILLSLMIAGCGGSEAKRSVDARVEALRFFGSDAPLVALLDTGPQAEADRAALAASLRGLPIWDSLRRETPRLLHAAGIASARLRALTGTPEVEEGFAASQLAVGIGPGETRSVSPTLTVLVTDESAEMSRIFEQAADRGRLAPAGELDDARIYTSRDGAFAVRDGVMLAAATPLRLRIAIKTRDGDRADQLDDRNVEDLLEEVPEEAPLDVYANVPGLSASDPAVAELETPPAAWLKSLRDVVLAVSGTPQGLRIDAFGRLEGSPPAEESPPLGERPRQAALSRTAVTRLVAGGAARSSPLYELLVEAAPFEAAASVDGDELRATLRTAP